MSRKRKVKIIGSTGFQQVSNDVSVDCTIWEKLNKIKNIRDYDTLIVNLLPLSDQEKREGIKWSDFRKIFNFQTVLDILSHDGEIIIVGDPRFDIPWSESSDNSNEGKKPFLNWTGINFIWDPQPGDTKHFRNDYRHREFEKYISKLNKWEYSFYNCEINKEIISNFFNMNKMKEGSIKLEIDKDFFCYNRYNNALAFILKFVFVKRKYDREEIINSYGPLIILPKITLNEDETIQIVLQEICGVHASLPEPEWLSEYHAPGQKEVDEKIRQIHADIDNIFKELDEANKQRNETRKCLKLLYEREYALEPVVRDILRKLGAHVEDPSENNKEDGWISIQIGEKVLEGVLEIKSTKSDQFDENGRKQLLDWIDRGRTLREKNYKGIFIGSNSVDKPVKERPYAFSDSWSKAAKLSNICALKTEELYIIYLLFTMNKININSFWEELFKTNGVFDSKDFITLLLPKDSDKSVNT